jgi:hypothetical protein
MISDIPFFIFPLLVMGTPNPAADSSSRDRRIGYFFFLTAVPEEVLVRVAVVLVFVGLKERDWMPVVPPDFFTTPLVLTLGLLLDLPWLSWFFRI